MSERLQSFLRGCGVAVVMFAFGFALVPLYDTICDWTGLNGRADGTVAESSVVESVDESRTIAVEFVTTVNGGKAWEFAPEVQRMEVHPGKLYTVNFSAQNPESNDQVAQAVPSVVPWKAAQYLRKTECFCFQQQSFAANERRDMPMRFIIDRDLPPEVDTVTLSYTFFEVTQTASAD